jgi:hypothetical protein
MYNYNVHYLVVIYGELWGKMGKMYAPHPRHRQDLFFAKVKIIKNYNLYNGISTMPENIFSTMANILSVQCEILFSG